jgi:predicted outer membrane repeat protein
MTDDRLPLADLLAKAGDGDFLRSVTEAVQQMLMEADVEGLIGAGRHERTSERLQGRLARLCRHKRFARTTLIAVFEGNNAAGKGGAVMALRWRSSGWRSRSRNS